MPRITNLTKNSLHLLFLISSRMKSFIRELLYMSTIKGLILPLSTDWGLTY